jgi:hypothetical protein
MSTSTTIDLIVPEEVLAEVRRKSAEVEFQSFRETIVDHFADARDFEIELLEDPDEEDRNWVVFRFMLPADTSIDEANRRENDFFADLNRRRPHIAWPICTLSYRFAQGT